MSKKIEEILNEVCDCNKYCFLKDLFVNTHPHGQRNLYQLRCVEKLKYERSFREKHDIGWEGALDVWLKEGYAAQFSEVYDKDSTWDEIYKRLDIK